MNDAIQNEINMQKPQNTKNRVRYIDIARGIAIILMVIGHVLEHGLKRNIIFSFHMPLFIIVSGIFYKERSIKETIKNVLIKLILPYIICTFVVSFFTVIIYKTSIEYAFVEWIKQICFSYAFWGDINFGVSATPLSVLWFFPLLAISKLIFTAIKKISKDNDITLFCISVFVSYLGYILGIKKYWLPFSIDVAMASVIFYYVGYKLKREQILDQILKNNKLLVIFLLFWIIGIKYNWIELAIRRYPNGLFSFITAITGTMIIFKISILIDKYLSNVSKILCWYGRNSSYVLIMHYVESWFINYDIFQNEDLTIMKLKVSCFKLVLITIATKLLEEILMLYKYIKNIFK